MTNERTIQIEIAPHLKTEEGAKRFNAAVEQRTQADYECFCVLRDLNETGVLSHYNLAQAFIMEGADKLEANEWAGDLIEQIKEVLQKRRDADAAFSDALLGR